MIKGNPKEPLPRKSNSHLIVLPAETRDLAEQMASEFAGTEQDWRRSIKDPMRYRFQYGKGHGNGNGGGQGSNPGGGPGDGDGDIDHSDAWGGGHNRAPQPMTFPLGFNQGGMQRPMAQPQMQQPVQAQSQIPGQRPLTPEMISLIRNYMSRG